MASVGKTQTASWAVYRKVGLAQTFSWDVTGASIQACPDDGRCGPFELVNADFMIEGNTRVSWTMRQNFAAPSPYTFQLQVGETGSNYADDWVNIGAPVQNTYLIVDPVKRAFGKQLTVHYRVQLTDNNGTVYVSQPSVVLGALNFKD